VARGLDECGRMLGGWRRHGDRNAATNPDEL
jgi:hypothetical protein